MKVATLLIIGVLAWGSATADEASRNAKVASIIEAQGLMQSFQAQLDQSKATASELGRGMVKKIMADGGMPEGRSYPKLEQIFQGYMERCATMFSAQEMVSIWASFYGKNMSEPELEQVLAYYRSPIGRKDTASSQEAVTGFSQVLTRQVQQRLDASMSQLMSELKAAVAEATTK